MHRICGRSSSGRAPPCQGGGSEFEPRRPLQYEAIVDAEMQKRWLFCFALSALSVTYGDSSPKGRALGITVWFQAQVQSLWFRQSLSLWERWHRAAMTERARMLPAIFVPFFHKHFGRCGKTARRVYLFAQKRGKISCKIRKCALRRLCRAGRTSSAPAGRVRGKDAVCRDRPLPPSQRPPGRAALP